jgi:hypothetical protein
MATTPTLARKPAPSPADTTPPNAQEHIQAARLALEKALQALSGDACTAAEIQIATGRAIRAATLLKRACQAWSGRISNATLLKRGCKALEANTTSKGA